MMRWKEDKQKNRGSGLLRSAWLHDKCILQRPTTPQPKTVKIEGAAFMNSSRWRDAS